MKTFLLRNIKDDLYIEIKKQAEFNSESINKFVLSVLEGELGFKKQIKKKNITQDEFLKEWRDYFDSFEAIRFSIVNDILEWIREQSWQGGVKLQK